MSPMSSSPQNFELRPFATPDELARAAAEAWLKEIEAANRDGKSHCVALSGGRITVKLCSSTVEQAKAGQVSFNGVHFFWADERCVPPGDAESNFRMAEELLFVPLKIGASQIHRLRGEDDPAAAARAGEAEIRQVVASEAAGQPVLDLIFLGLGEDGHVASLFPGEPEEISGSKAVYRSVENSPKPPPQRITLGYGAIIAARQVWMLASGAGKTGALRESVVPSGKTPFGRVLKMRRNTRIFTDTAI
jgi:6-phosphogluconolactonase